MADDEGELGGVAACKLHCFPVPAPGHAHPVRQLHRGELFVPKPCSALHLYCATLQDLCVLLPLCGNRFLHGVALQILWCAYVSLVFNAQLVTVPDAPGHQAVRD